MIFGISATKSAVVIAETKGAGDKFVIIAIRPIPFQVRSGDDLTELLQSLITLFDRKGVGSVIALLKCSSGRFGSCLEAIKGEAMVELAAVQRGQFREGFIGDGQSRPQQTLPDFERSHRARGIDQSVV